MTHYGVLVIVPENTPNDPLEIEAAMRRLVDKYQERDGMQWMGLGPARYDYMGEAYGTKPVSEWLAEKTFMVAVVTPDGEWHEDGQTGWFGGSTGEMTPEQWRAEARRVMSAYPNNLAVGCDAHI